MDIVASYFSPGEFADYVASLDLPSCGWTGEFVVLHNTGSPTLAERPDGLTAQHIENLRSYYTGLGWHAGPHCFVDQNGIWVFSPLTEPGVHSPSWNSISYGVEQLGDYDTEAYDPGHGALVKANAIACVAVISHAAGIDSATMRLHKEDPETTHHDCPGAHCADEVGHFKQAVHDYIVEHLL